MKSIRSYFMAKFYNSTMKQSETLCLGQWRSELLSKLSGDVLEIGAGTGVNLQYYPDCVHRLVLSEPEPQMYKQLEHCICQSNRKQVQAISDGAEQLELPDESFDYVVSTLVLCSVNNQARALGEVYRLLRPGGAFVFIEHVAAENNPVLLQWQRRWEPFWRFFCGNCHLTKRTLEAIEDIGLQIESLNEVSMLGAAAVAKPTIKGFARKAENGC